MPATLLVTAPSRPQAGGLLQVSHGDQQRTVLFDGPPVMIGRGKDCTLRVDDPELRVSSMHVLIEHFDGRWFVKDVSRNGSWLEDAASAVRCQLPQSIRVELPARGRLSLGRSFADDPDGRFLIEFGLAGD